MAGYAEQFATVFLAVAGDYPLGEEEVIKYLAPMLRDQFTSSQYPSIDTVSIDTAEDEYGGEVVVGGPWDGVDILQANAQYITGVKWNLRTKTQDSVTAELLGTVRSKWRSTRADIRTQGYQVLNWSLKPYGDALTGDHGVPVTPPLPPRKDTRIIASGPVPSGSPSAKRFPWWLIPVGVAGIAAVANLEET